MALIGDWGVGLELALYEEALTHILGGEHNVVRPVPVFGLSGLLLAQPMRLLAPRIAFKLTAGTDRTSAASSSFTPDLLPTPQVKDRG